MHRFRQLSCTAFTTRPGSEAEGLQTLAHTVLLPPRVREAKVVAGVRQATHD